MLYQIIRNRYSTDEKHYILVQSMNIILWPMNQWSEYDIITADDNDTENRVKIYML